MKTVICRSIYFRDIPPVEYDQGKSNTGFSFINILPSSITYGASWVSITEVTVILVIICCKLWPVCKRHLEGHHQRAYLRMTWRQMIKYMIWGGISYSIVLGTLMGRLPSLAKVFPADTWPDHWSARAVKTPSSIQDCGAVWTCWDVRERVISRWLQTSRTQVSEDFKMYEKGQWIKTNRFEKIWRASSEITFCQIFQLWFKTFQIYFSVELFIKFIILNFKIVLPDLVC